MTVQKENLILASLSILLAYTLYPNQENKAEYKKGIEELIERMQIQIDENLKLEEQK